MTYPISVQEDEQRLQRWIEHGLETSRRKQKRVRQCKQQHGCRDSAQSATSSFQAVERSSERMRRCLRCTTCGQLSLALSPHSAVVMCVWRWLSGCTGGCGGLSCIPTTMLVILGILSGGCAATACKLRCFVTRCGSS